MMFLRRKIGSRLLLSVAALLGMQGSALFQSTPLQSTANAADTIWNGNVDTDFFNDGNWSAGAPTDASDYGVIDSTDANHVAIIAADTGTVALDGVNLGEFSGGGNVIQNGGVLEFDTFTETKIGGDGTLPSTWVMNNDSVILYDGPLNGGGNGYGSDGLSGSDFDVGNGPSVATFELHDTAILRIADDMKISDNGVAAGGHVLLDGNSQITVGSGTSMGSDGPATLTIAENALYVSGNSAGPGNSAEGYTNEGYLAFSEGTVLIKDQGRMWIRTLQARGNDVKPTAITVQDNGAFEIFDVFNHATPVLGTSTVVGSVNGNERTSEVAEGAGSNMTITVEDNGKFTVDTDLADSDWNGLALSGGTNRGGNGAGGTTLVDIKDSGTFTIQQDLHMTLGTDPTANSTLKVTGPDASVAINGDVRMAVDPFDFDNPGSAALHAVITALSHSTITVGGDINVDNGDLIVELDGYSPRGGETYTLVNAGSVTGGAFKSVDLSGAPLAEGLSWDLNVSDTSVVLSVLGSTGSIADLNVDGFVDGLDLGILLGEWNPQVAAAMGISQGAVPEPTSLALIGLAVACLPRSRRR